MTFLADIRAEIVSAGIDIAVNRRDTPTIFDWLLRHSAIRASRTGCAQLHRAKRRRVLVGHPSQIVGLTDLSTLRQYWTFSDCRYNKTSFSCSEPEHIDSCPLPSHRLRNGRLNQTAYSFFLFVRDIAKSDFVGWIDAQLASQSDPMAGGLNVHPTPNPEPLLGPLRNVYGVSDKILTMALSGLLLGASSGRRHWFEAGSSMIAIDSLVHNFLHRTGILGRCGTLTVMVSAAMPAAAAPRSSKCSQLVLTPVISTRVSQGISEVHSARHLVLLRCRWSKHL